MKVGKGAHGQVEKKCLHGERGGRLRIRTINDGVTTWNSYKTPEDHRQQMDILDVRILRPHQRETSDGEAIVLRRADGEVIKVENSGADGFTQTARFCGRPEDFSCMDISADAEPILAAFGNSGINLYSVRTSEKFVKPTASTKLEAKPGLQSRMRSAKFLASNSVALATQFLKGMGPCSDQYLRCKQYRSVSITSNRVGTFLRHESSSDRSSQPQCH